MFHGMITDDLELLSQYVRQRSEAAFTELVQRHINLVFAAALRQVGGDVPSAEDVTQTVFTDLARKARGLLGHANLVGWLYQATRYAAANARRSELRRKAKEQEVQAMSSPATGSAAEPVHEQLLAQLDAAMHSLSSSDQGVLLLRFFESKDLKSVGSVIGVSENAARMRVDRALEKLRSMLARRGAGVSLTALAAALGSQASVSAPAGLAATVAGSAMLTAVAGGGVTLSLSNLMNIPITKIAAAVLITAGITVPVALHEHHLASRLANENQTLIQKAAELNQLRAENQRLATSQVDAVELDRLRQQQTELLKLRGEVGVLRQDKILLDHLQQRAAEQERRVAIRQASEVERNTARLLADSARAYLNRHNDEFPTNFEAMINELPYLRTNVEQMSRFEFFPHPRTISETEPGLILFREKKPRQLPDGQWVRVYTLADGSVHDPVTPDGNFEAFEKPRTAEIPNR